MVLAAGTRIRDYEVVRLIGEGGMGEVYLAKDTVLDRMVALKRIKDSETRDAHFHQRFLNEARIQARLSDPHIVSLYTCFEEHGTYYIAMEYAPGITLETLIRHTGPIPEQRALHIFRQIASALDHAHSQGVIHRDVKPSNIIVDTEHGDKAKVGDFGIARMMLEGHITRTGTQMGSPYYMSPEQVLAEKDVDNRSDIFSAGIVLFEMLTGRLPYEVDTDSIYKVHDQILRAPLPDPRRYYEYISEGSIAILNQLTAKDRNARPWSLGQVLAPVASLYPPSDRPRPQPKRAPLQNAGNAKPASMPPFTNTPDKPAASNAANGEPQSSGAPSGKRRLWMVLGVLAIAVLAFAGYKLYLKPARDGMKGDTSWMVRVEGGSFTMGTNDHDADDDERPPREITVSSFYISPYELTQAEWVKYMPTNPSTFSGDDRPVEGISWFDAVRYCNLRSEAEGLTPCYSGTGDATLCDWSASGYRLPTEAEWEYAAKGGIYQSDTIYAGGSNISSVAWYDQNSSGSTHPVGSKAPNGLGLYDMSGNVYEWCWDRYSKPNPQWTHVNPKGAEKGSQRVARGGSWSVDDRSCRVSFRSNYKPEATMNNKGLRLVRGIPQ